MAIKSVNVIFSGERVLDIHTIIKSQATCDPYERRLIDFVKRREARSPLMLSLILQNIILHLLEILAYSKEQVNGNS
jgi:FtsH-binding integral membrane protein